MSNTKIWMLSIFIISLIAGSIFFGPIVGRFLIAIVIAYLLYPLSDRLNKKLKIPRVLAVALVLIFAILVISAVIFALAPPVYDQVLGLLLSAPDYFDFAMSWIENVLTEFEHLDLPPFIKETVTEGVKIDTASITKIITSAAISIASAPGFIIILIIQLILIAYFLYDGKMLIEKMAETFTGSSKERVDRIVEKSNKMVWNYVRAKTILAIGIGVFCFIGYTFFGLKYALLLAVIAFVLDFIPFFGSIISGIIAVIVSVFELGLPGCLWVALFVFAAQQLEGNIIGPKIQSDSTGIHPVTVLFALLAANYVWGPVSMFIAVPVAAFIKIIFMELKDLFNETK